MHHVGWQLMEKRLRLGVWTATPLLVQFAPRRQTCPNTPASCWKIASSNSVGSPRIPAATGTTVAPTAFPPCKLWTPKRMKPSLPAATLRKVSKYSPWLSAQEVIPNAYPLRALPNTGAYRWRQYLPDVEAYSPCATRKVHSQGFNPLGLYPGHH